MPHQRLPVALPIVHVCIYGPCTRNKAVALAGRCHHPNGDSGAHRFRAANILPHTADRGKIHLNGLEDAPAAVYAPAYQPT